MAPSSTPWNDLNIEALKRLWAEGYSARDIAHELGPGFSRCAVLGKINRLGGLERRQPPQPRQPRELTVPRGRPIKRRPMLTMPPPPPPPLPPPCEPVKKPRPRRLQLLQLQEHHCRWPVGDPRGHPFYFCAADRAGGDNYCPFHMRKAFAKPRGST